MDTVKKQPTGSLKISEDVLATIAKVAALEIDGVAALAELAGSMGRFFSRGLGKSAIQIELSDDFAKISIALDLFYGAKVTEVCAAVQANIKENIQTMTGMAVSKVNVVVVGIVFEEVAAVQ